MRRKLIALLYQLEKLEKAATPAPWRKPEPGWIPPESMGMRAEYLPDGWYPEHNWDFRVNADFRDDQEENGVAYQCQEQDAALIAELRNAAPDLIRALRDAWKRDAEKWRALILCRNVLKICAETPEQVDDVQFDAVFQAINKAVRDDE